MIAIALVLALYSQDALDGYTKQDLWALSEAFRLQSRTCKAELEGCQLKLAVTSSVTKQAEPPKQQSKLFYTVSVLALGCLAGVLFGAQF